MPDLCYHNLTIYVIFNWFVLRNLYCPFLLFVKKKIKKNKKTSHFMFLHVNWNVCF